MLLLRLIEMALRALQLHVMFTKRVENLFEMLRMLLQCVRIDTNVIYEHDDELLQERRQDVRHEFLKMSWRPLVAKSHN